MKFNINGVHTLPELEKAIGAYCYKNKIAWNYFIDEGGNSEIYEYDPDGEISEFELNHLEIVEIHDHTYFWNIIFAR